MKVWLGTFVSVAIVSLISLVGIFFLLLKKDKLNKIQLILVGLAAGGLLGGAFFHLLPEAFEAFKKPLTASILLVSGFLMFYILERFLHWQHDHSSAISENHIKPFGPINLIADAFHNFLDGILIGAAFYYKFEIGIATALSVLMHELPHEFGNFGVLVHAGYTPRRALVFNFLSACSSFLGAFAVLIFSNIAGILSVAVLPFAAGGFIYLAAADLIPELQREKAIIKSIYQFLALLLGAGIMLVVLLFSK
jgi:zinc and cadmium transporter